MRRHATASGVSSSSVLRSVHRVSNDARQLLAYVGDRTSMALDGRCIRLVGGQDLANRELRATYFLGLQTDLMRHDHQRRIEGKRQQEEESLARTRELAQLRMAQAEGNANDKQIAKDAVEAMQKEREYQVRRRYL